MHCHRQYQKHETNDAVVITYRLHDKRQPVDTHELRYQSCMHDHDILLGQEMRRILKLLHQHNEGRLHADMAWRRESNGIRFVIMSFSYSKSFFPILERRLQLLSFEQIACCASVPL